jgi:hypothetical protein
MTVVYAPGQAPPNLLRVGVVEANPRTLGRYLVRLVGGEHQVDVLALFGVDERDLPVVARRCIAAGYRFYAAHAARSAASAPSLTASPVVDVLVSRFTIAPDRKFSLYSNTPTGRGLTITRLVLGGGGGGGGGGATLLVAASSLDGDLSTAASQLKCVVRALPTFAASSDIASLLLLRDPSRLRPKHVQIKPVASGNDAPAQAWSSTIDAIDAEHVVGGRDYATASLDVWSRDGGGGGGVGVLGVDRVCVDAERPAHLLDQTPALVGVYTIATKNRDGG